jgi:transposase-like protein
VWSGHSHLSRSLLRADATVAERRALSDVEKANYSIVWMCQMLGVARSSFYAWRNQVETATSARRRELREHIGGIFEKSRRTYGCRRVAAALNREGSPRRRGAGGRADARAGLAGLPAARLQAHDHRW